MKKFRKQLLMYMVVGVLLLSCKTASTEDQYGWIRNGIDVASAQLLATADSLLSTQELPRSLWTGYKKDFLCWQLEKDSLIFEESLSANPPKDKIGKLRTCNIYDWTSGFFPGSLWYAYELTRNERLKSLAIKYTNLLNPIRTYKDNHDIGFMMNCSYGNALRLSPHDSIKTILVEAADNLCTRFNSQVGAIRSWDFGEWNYPVIIDNMMNLELLFVSSKIADNGLKYKSIAIEHAEKTKSNHFRPDYTCWHVVSYNDDGTVERKQTFQGKNDDSSWARGQAWAAYGYTVCYRETNNPKYLNLAIQIADMIMSRVKTEDAIPYWDYDAIPSTKTPRDASAAAITASALLELSIMIPDNSKYVNYAEKILKSLSSKAYLSEIGENKGFILMHSTGSLPHGSEIDTPINYADYYYLEALQRFMKLKQIQVY